MLTFTTFMLQSLSTVVLSIIIIGMGMVPSIIDVFIIAIEHQLLKLDTNGPDGISASILRN